MAGRPRTRQKQLAEALRLGIDPDSLITPAPSPGVEPLDGPGSTRARARARAQAQGAPRVAMGPETRRAMDQRTAEDLGALAAQLRPGLTVRLERLRPLFAAGFVDDVPIDDSDLGALLADIREEHGGQVYRATVLGTDGTPLYIARLPIAGPPRRAGRVMPRSAWDGTDADGGELATVRGAPPAAVVANPGSGLTDALALFDRLEQMSRRGEDATLGAVREMVGSHQRQTTELLQAIFERSEVTRPTLRQQLHEVAEATQAIEEIREVLGAPNGGGETAQGPLGQSVMKSAIERMAADVLTQGLMNDQARAARRAAQQQQGASRPANFRRVQRKPGAQQQGPRRPGNTGSGAPQ